MPDHWVLGFCVMVIIVQDLGKYMIIGTWNLRNIVYWGPSVAPTGGNPCEPLVATMSTAPSAREPSNLLKTNMQPYEGLLEGH